MTRTFFPLTANLKVTPIERDTFTPEQVARLGAAAETNYWFALASQKSCFLETEVSGATTTGLPHDKVIKEVDIQNSCAPRDSFGEFQVPCRRASES